MGSSENRHPGDRLQKKVEKEIFEEYNRQTQSLRDRPDYSQDLEYFLEVLSLTISPRKIKTKYRRPLVGLYCIQAPLELFDALGFQPIRLGNGSIAVQRLSAGLVPVISCPLIKSCIGSFYLKGSIENNCDVVILPTTCDWNAKLPLMLRDKDNHFHIMELPHIKESERGRIRWIEEIYELKGFLQKLSKQKLDRKKLIISINKYMKAWDTFNRLTELRRKNQISGIWYIILSNAFLVDEVEEWTEKTKKLLAGITKLETNNNPGVFLAGAPIFFPYLKVPELIEEAGMSIIADELCTSERIIASMVYDEPSEYGLFKALADRYYLACSCPTYIDNDRRINVILHAMRKYNIKGVVYHLLKGCHPYEIESLYFEKKVKENGLRFLKVETDYSREDKQNILTRLEAFRETIQ